MSDPLTRILLIVWKLLVGQMELSQPQPSGIYPPPQDKPRRFSRNALIGIIIIIATLLAAGGYGGNRSYQDTLQPNVQATADNIGTLSTSPSSYNGVKDARGARPGSSDCPPRCSG